MQEKTQEEFLRVMLNNLSNTEDKTPNSFSYDILSAAAIVFEDFQRVILELFKKFDVMNLEDEELDARVLQIAGIKRKQATQSTGEVTITGLPKTVIPKETVFLAGSVEFTIDQDYVIPESGNIIVAVKSVVHGGDANVLPNAIDKISPQIMGVDNISNAKEIMNGYDQETDDDLRERYLEKLLHPPKAGNPAHYKLWATEVDGIWNAKVFRTWQGGGTVKVVVIGLNRKAVGPDLIEKVKKHILEEAPIRYESLTVESATTKRIKVDVKIKLTQNANLIEVKQVIKERIEKYFYSISFKENTVSYAKVGAEILKVPGVADYDVLKLNGSMGNAEMKETEVPELESLGVTTDE
ncbi:MAG: baseplate J/gp47 family protein [Peptoniphilus sp.]|uniref:baseplate J/gp47 family protein n=1 Tax=Peptoniphilus sp. TaxID=1971214 RepID=UPI0025DC352E|nr:baseplate J/gp47 family protein [Peptoniphilus sp.]MCI5643842.1 baseplate J/gp47 family protein [Peptoniphilus sp.]